MKREEKVSQENKEQMLSYSDIPRIPPPPPCRHRKNQIFKVSKPDRYIFISSHLCLSVTPRKKTHGDWWCRGGGWWHLASVPSYPWPFSRGNQEEKERWREKKSFLSPKWRPRRSARLTGWLAGGFLPFSLRCGGGGHGQAAAGLPSLERQQRMWDQITLYTFSLWGSGISCSSWSGSTGSGRSHLCLCFLICWPDILWRFVVSNLARKKMGTVGMG